MGDAYADIPKHGGDYAKAIAVCINSGQCETDNKQVMCPSFKVSGDSHLSTGGRVRLLKAALSSDDWQEAMADPELARAMDLCVSCKGCKRECDNNVDMALIKAEYLAWRAQRQGLSLRSRLFAHTPRLLYHLPALRHLILWRNRSSWLSALSEKWLGLSKAMPLPVPAAQPYRGQVADNSTEPMAQQKVGDVLPEVVLLVDTFTRYFEPEIAVAAETVLRAGGYSVYLALSDDSDSNPHRPFCCGRTYLAQGMVEQARAEVSRLVAALTPHVQAGRVVVGLEASCVLGLRDDALALALGLGDPLREISNQVFLFEEFLAREVMAKRLNLPLQALPDVETLVHGHCHQKAVGAMKAVHRVLKLIPGHRFSMIEYGCCGMANQGLMSSLKADREARVVANGYFCRQQMRAHGDQRPRHLARLLRVPCREMVSPFKSGRNNCQRSEEVNMSNAEIQWDSEALTRLERAPVFIRKMARNKVEKAALDQGVKQITVEFMERIKQQETGK